MQATSKRTKSISSLSSFLRFDRLRYWKKFRLNPAVADMRVKWSTLRSRSICSPQRPLTILVDTQIWERAVSHEGAWISTGEHEYGGSTISTGYSARVPVHDPSDVTEDYSDLHYFAGIAHLAKVGSLKLRTSAHLLGEQDYQPTARFRGYDYDAFSLLGPVEIEPIDAWLLSELGGGPLYYPYSPESLRAHIEKIGDDRYRQLRDCLGSSNSQDAWHIRTAERHGAFCFLTMDRKLLKAIESQRGHKAIRALSTEVWTPTKLGQHLRLRPISPLTMSFHNGDAPVRNDLHLSGRRR